MDLPHGGILPLGSAGSAGKILWDFLLRRSGEGSGYSFCEGVLWVRVSWVR